MEVKFTVLGEPKGKGRPKFSRRGQYVQTYTPDATASYENLVKLEYERQCGGKQFSRDTPLEMRIMAYFSIPKSKSEKVKQLMRHKVLRPTKKPDIDNIVKIIADGLNGVAYYDDAQIVDASVRKFYSGKPRVVVTILEVRN